MVLNVPEMLVSLPPTIRFRIVPPHWGGGGKSLARKVAPCWPELCGVCGGIYGGCVAG